MLGGIVVIDWHPIPTGPCHVLQRKPADPSLRFSAILSNMVKSKLISFQGN